MYHPLTARRIEQISMAQTTPRLSLRQKLNNEYTKYMMVARGYRSSRNPADVAKREHAEEQMADLSEQLTLLDAIELGYIKPLPDHDTSDAAALGRLLNAVMYPETVEGWEEGDPRSADEQALDEWAQDWRDTNESNRP